MFNKLVASEGRKKGFWSPTTIVVSVVFHGILVAAGWAANVNIEERERRADELVQYVDLQEEQQQQPEPEPEPEPEPTPPPPTPEAPPPVARGFQELVPPSDPPDRIPDVNPADVAVRQEDFSGIGQRGGVAAGVDQGVAQDVSRRETPPDQGTYELSAVEEQPSLTNAAEFARQLERNYPPLLRDAGVTGTVMVRMRINEDGRVDASSIQIMETSHEQFGDATRRAVERLRFRPARVSGRPVKVWVELPVQWRMSR